MVIIKDENSQPRHTWYGVVLECDCSCLNVALLYMCIIMM